MRIIRCKNSLTAILSGGRTIQRNDCTDELYDAVKALYEEDNEFDLINLLIPEEPDGEIDNVRLIQFWKDEEKSQELTKEDNSVYWKSVSSLSLPMSFAEKIMKAEKQGDTVKLNAYRNFWTLLSLNPDPDVRQNLFKFLEKWGMVITKSGLFVGYRNADLYREGNQYEGTIYTDHHSGTTRIMIGRMVTLPREKCDCDSNVSCSSGLHIGGTSWLDRYYYGNYGLVCLVNPVDVCAVPWYSGDNYGKLRCCAYLPIAEAEWDETGHIVPFRTDSGFEEPFVPTILYDGVTATEDNAAYVIPIPRDMDNNIYSQETVSEKLLNIARQFMKDKDDN